MLLRVCAITIAVFCCVLFLDAPIAFAEDGGGGGKEDIRHTAMMLGIIFGSIAAVFAFVGVLIFLAMRNAKKRTAEMEAVAGTLGMSFSARGDEALLERLKSFSLFNQGHGRKMKNVMSAETELAKLTIFDYQFATGGGNHSQTHHHTIAAMESNPLHFPQFSVSPEGFFSRLGAKIGMQDIDFDEDPEFSSAFVLKGADEAAIRAFFTTPILDLFASQKGISVDATSGLFTYMHSKHKKPEEIQAFMAEAYAFYTAFQEHAFSSDASA